MGLSVSETGINRSLRAQFTPQVSSGDKTVKANRFSTALHLIFVQYQARVFKVFADVA